MEVFETDTLKVEIDKKNKKVYLYKRDKNKVIENFIILDKEEIELLIDINFYLYDIDG